MAGLTTEQLDETRRILAAADDYDNPDIHEARAVLTHRVPPLLDEIERLRSLVDWLKSSMDFLMEIVDATQKKDQANRTALILRLARAEQAARESRELRDGLVDESRRCSVLRGEAETAVRLMDELAEQWGDEAVFRRCRDRLRAAVEAAQEAGT